MPTRNTPSPVLPCETALSAIDLFLEKERAALQAEIQRLQTENAMLQKENSDLLRQIISNSTSPTIVAVDCEKAPEDPKDYLVGALLDKIHHCQRFLVKERQAAAMREASFGQNLRMVKRQVMDTLNSGFHHHQELGNASLKVPESAPTYPRPNSLPPYLPPPSPPPQKDQEARQTSHDVIDRIIVLSTNLSRRTEEVKKIRKLAESKAEQAASRISRLERKSEGLSLLRAHNNQADLELDVLKLRLKKLETIALEFVPLVDQDILLDFEAYKDELLKVQTRQKQRRRKEERWSLWKD